MRALLAAALLLVAALPAEAQRKYAVMSVAGDALLIVQREPGVGSSIDRNRRESIAVKNSALDNVVISAIDDTLKDQDPKVQTLMLGGRYPALQELQVKAIESGSVAALVAAIRPAAEKAGATHLILASKFRDEARLKLADGSIGAGRVEGFGFYLDSHTELRDSQTGATGRGYIAPFVYLTITLVDLSTGNIVAQDVVRAAQAAGNQTAAAAAPWDSLTPEQKIGMLRYLLQEEIHEVVPKLVRK